MNQAIKALRELALEHDAQALDSEARRFAVLLEFLNTPAFAGFDFDRVFAVYRRQARAMRAH